MDLGSIFVILALAILVGMFISQPLMKLRPTQKLIEEVKTEQAEDHVRSTLLAERDRMLTALQELEFDHTLGKIPEEDYPQQRAFLLKAGADVLRKLDEIEPNGSAKLSAEDRVEAAVAARRADARKLSVGEMDELEIAIAARRREREGSSAGFCPKCGNPIQTADVFCSRCGTTI